MVPPGGRGNEWGNLGAGSPSDHQGAAAASGLVYRAFTLLLSAFAVAGQVALVLSPSEAGRGDGVPGLGPLRPAVLSTVLLTAVVSLVSAALGVAITMRRSQARGDARRASPSGSGRTCWRTRGSSC